MAQPQVISTTHTPQAHKRFMYQAESKENDVCHYYLYISLLKELEEE